MDAEIAAGSGQTQRMRTSRKRPIEDPATLRFLMTARSGPIDQKRQAQMQPGHQPVLGHAGSVPTEAPQDVFRRTMTPCGHTHDVSCHKCGGAM